MYNGKKILILGGSEFQIPLVKKAKELGMLTYVVDISKNAPAIEYADYYYEASVKDKEKILEFAKTIKPDGLTVGMVDIAVQTCAYVASELNLPGMSLQTAIQATNKYEMIKVFKECNVPHPKFKYVENSRINEIQSSDVGFPAIVKPIDMAGSRGIYLVKNIEELKKAVNESSQIGDTGDLLIEEYMNGPEVSVEMVIKKGKPIVIQITDKTTTGAPHFAEIGHLQPSQLSDQIKKEIEKVACEAAKSIGLVNSLAHAEIKITTEGPKMVEIGARAGGDAIGEQLLYLSTGVDFSKIAIDIALGFEISIPEIKNMFSCIRFIQSHKGTLKAINGIEFAKKIKNVNTIKISAEIGKKYNDVIDNSGRLGYVIANGKTLEEVIVACNEAINSLKVEYEKEDEIND